MINAIDLAKLRNAEFLQFGATFSGLVASNNPVALNVAPQHLAFKRKLDETSGLFNLERVSPITQELVLLDERRDKAKREEMMVAYYELRKFIDGYAVIHASAAYDKLINELNALIDQYNTLLNSRASEPVPEPAAAPAAN